MEQNNKMTGQVKPLGVGSSGSLKSLFNPSVHEKPASGLPSLPEQDKDRNPKARFSRMGRIVQASR